MGAKTWMLVTGEKNPRDVFTKQPSIDRDLTYRVAQEFFPDEQLSALEDGDLYYTNPPDDELFIGAYDGVCVVAAGEFGLDNPSQLSEAFVSARGITTLHAMHSVVDWFAFAQWIDGTLVRALSLSPDSGIIEDLGDRMDFEKPFWDGEFPAVEDDEDVYPFEFHPLDLGEAALLHFFGYQIEGVAADNLFDPDTITLMRFQRIRDKRRKPWNKIW